MFNVWGSEFVGLLDSSKSVGTWLSIAQNYFIYASVCCSIDDSFWACLLRTGNLIPRTEGTCSRYDDLIRHILTWPVEDMDDMPKTRET